MEVGKNIVIISLFYYLNIVGKIKILYKYWNYENILLLLLGILFKDIRVDI